MKYKKSKNVTFRISKIIININNIINIKETCSELNVTTLQYNKLASEKGEKR